MSKKLVIAGAGGHGRVVLDAALAAGFKPAGFLDIHHARGALINGLEVLGGNELLDDGVFLRDHLFVVAIGNQTARLELSRKVEALEGQLATIIHPFSCISPTAKIGRGTVVIAGTIVNANADVRNYCILNTACTIDHDNLLADGVQVCPGAHLAGNVVCEEGAFIGTGASIIPGIQVGCHAYVGAGSVVNSNVPPHTKIVGNPARVVSRPKP